MARAGCDSNLQFATQTSDDLWKFYRWNEGDRRDATILCPTQHHM